MERWEGLQGLDPAGEDAPKGVGGATSVRHVLSCGGPGSPPFWGGDLGFVIRDVHESGGVTCGFTKADIETEGGTMEQQDLAEVVSREGP